MASIAPFDYAGLDPETRIVVRQKTGEIRDRTKRAAQQVVEIGQRLAEVKARLGHGAFGRWLEAEFDWTDQTARRFMWVAERFGQNQQIVDFAPSALYLLAAPTVPEGARQEALATAANGQHVSHSTARRIIEDHKPEAAPGRKSTAPSTIPRPSWPEPEPRADEHDDDDPVGVWPGDADDDRDDSPDDEWPPVVEDASKDEGGATIEDAPGEGGPESGDGPGPDDDGLDDADFDDPEGEPDGSRESASQAAAPRPKQRRGFEKLWNYIGLFLRSLPRRGGIVRLMRRRDFSKPMVQGTYSEFLAIRKMLDDCIAEMEDEYPWLDRA